MGSIQKISQKKHNIHNTADTKNEAKRLKATNSFSERWRSDNFTGNNREKSIMAIATLE